MANFFRYLRDLFQEVDTSSPSQPAAHELIVRDADQLADYEQWQNSLIKKRLIAWLADQYAIYRVLPKDVDEAIDFLHTPSSKGFVIHFNKTNYNRREVTHFFDYLKERVIAQNYRVQISDTRTYTRTHWVETQERHYLKPRTSFDPHEKQEQGYGNITILLELHDDKVHQLRLQATHYQDHQYEEAEEFADLMQVLLA